MKIDRLTAMWEVYRRDGVRTQIHADDHMFNSNARLDDYDIVGESALEVIFAALALSRKQAVYRVLDFGCGHGRVGRYLRGMFPKAQLWFADIDPSCTTFCAAAFGGQAVHSAEDLNLLDLPSGIDLIWVGSVFTHLDEARQHALFKKLYGALGLGGLLVATFHGRTMYGLVKANAAQAAAYKSAIETYEKGQIGYSAYPNAAGQVGMKDWGVSLSPRDRTIAMANDYPEARLVMFSESGWANIHDVGVWSKG